ncbi:toxin-antitoxin system YwqK family antitoxin [Reichenbachiella sp.]|uniref:toxin-antitoxin system YwqK family antitoxin n=1 Tax=Reichenbachiella sp. TaxID=2184521 RepID=UPI003B59EBF6
MHLKKCTLLCLVFILSPFFTKAQNFYKEVTVDTTFQAKGVVVSGKREGYWKFERRRDGMIVTGYYSQGIPDSVWLKYFDQSVSEAILLREGKKEGPYNSFDNFGSLISSANFENDVLHGAYFEYYDNALVALSGYYKEGKKDSIWIERSSLGNKNYEKFYEDGLPVGTWTYYYSNGRIKRTETYQFGLLNGKVEEYHYNRKKTLEANYINGVRNGKYREYFKDGSLSVEGQYQSDLKSGTWVSMTPQGIMFSIGQYQAGHKQGLWKYFHESGTLQSEGKYKNNLKDAQWIDYYESGKLKSIGAYQADLKNGLWGHFYENEQLIQDENWKHGLLLDVSEYFSEQGETLPKGTLSNGNGSRNVYYLDGELQVQENYLDGLPHGTWISYHDNGKISSDEKYKKGEPTGTWKYYNRKGKLKRSRRF